jgi:hypothetical protein
MTVPGPEFWTSLIEKAATVALAAFSIWVLQREYQRQLQERADQLGEARDEHRQEREQLVCVIERNTEAWQKATQTMGEIATGVAMLVSTIDRNREDISGIRILLARRPCIADAAIQDRDPDDDPDGGHPRPAPGSSSGP